MKKITGLLLLILTSSAAFSQSPTVLDSALYGSWRFDSIYTTTKSLTITSALYEQKRTMDFIVRLGPVGRNNNLSASYSVDISGTVSTHGNNKISAEVFRLDKSLLPTPKWAMDFMEVMNNARIYTKHDSVLTISYAVGWKANFTKIR